MSSDDLLDKVPTKASLFNQSNFKATVFVPEIADQPKPLQQKKSTKQLEPESENDDDGFDIKKARHEIINFALSGYRNQKHKRKTEITLAVKLGAKPPPKPYKNYKQLIMERKNLKNVREERKKFSQLGKTQTGLASVKCKSKTQKEKDGKKRAPVSNIGNHYGVANPKFKTKKKK